MDTSASLATSFANLPSLLLRHRFWVGVAAIVLCILTWAIDLFELTYQCPFCRVQRTVIGLLGVLLLLPNRAHWLVRYLGSIFALFGIVVGSTQHFRGWARIMSGEFEWGEQWYMNSWMLSGFAIGIITALVMIIWNPSESDKRSSAT